MRHLILYAEDEEQLAKMYITVFKQAGYDVNHVMNGRGALKKYDEEAPDIIVLDILMPYSGKQVAIDIRKRDAETPILMLTSVSDIEEEIKSLKLGADDYVRKGVETEVLLAKIRRLIERHPVNRDSKLIITPDTYIDRVNGILYSVCYSDKISYRDNNLLHLLWRNRNKPLKREYLESQIWGDKEHLSEEYLSKSITHIRKIMNGDKRIKLHAIPNESITFVIK